MSKYKQFFTHANYLRALISLSLSLTLLSCTDRNNLQVLTGNSMGTSYTIKYYGNRSISIQKLPKAIQGDIQEILVRINASMSTYDPSSELSKLNSSSTNAKTKISEDLYLVLKQAILIGSWSKGYYDITIGPLVDLWGFGPAKHRTSPPDEKTIKKLLTKVGYKNIQLIKERDNFYLRKKNTALRIDLSSIAKGYAVDKVASYLERKGITNYMVEIGGEVKTKGTNVEGEIWRIAIEKPNYDRKRELHSILPLKDLCMATSGNYRNFFKYKDKVFSHTLNPLTGKPVVHSVASVTVLHPSCTMADGLATAMSAMGKDRGLKIAQERNLAVYFIITENFNNFLSFASDKFQSYQKMVSEEARH